MAKLFQLVSNDEILELIDFLSRYAHESSLQPSKKQLAMLSFLLAEPGAVLSETTLSVSKKRARKPFDLKLRNGQVLTQRSANALKKSLLETAEDAELSYSGTSNKLLAHIHTLAPGRYTLSIDPPIAHSWALQIHSDNSISLFDPSSGMIAQPLKPYLKAIKKYYGLQQFHCQIVGYGITHPLVKPPITLTDVPRLNSMYSAINMQNTDTIDTLLALNPKLMDEPLVHIAVSREREHALEHLLIKGLDPNAVNQEGKTPLSFAIITHKSLNIIQCLLRHDADPNQPKQAGAQPLLLALSRSETTLEMIDALLAKGADPTIHDQSGAHVIVTAIAKSDPAIVKRLLEDPRIDPTQPLPVYSRSKGLITQTLAQIARSFKRPELLPIIQSALLRRAKLQPLGQGAFAFAKHHTSSSQGPKLPKAPATPGD